MSESSVRNSRSATYTFGNKDCRPQSTTTHGVTLLWGPTSEAHTSVLYVRAASPETAATAQQTDEADRDLIDISYPTLTDLGALFRY